MCSAIHDLCIHATWYMIYAYMPHDTWFMYTWYVIYAYMPHDTWFMYTWYMIYAYVYMPHDTWFMHMYTCYKQHTRIMMRDLCRSIHAIDRQTDRQTDLCICIHATSEHPCDLCTCIHAISSIHASWCGYSAGEGEVVWYIYEVLRGLICIHVNISEYTVYSYIGRGLVCIYLRGEGEVSYVYIYEVLYVYM